MRDDYAMTTIPTDISDSIIDLLAATTDDAIDDSARALYDAIIDNADAITMPLATAILSAARISDPTDSYIAAILRDAIRDNTDLTIF